MFRLIPGDGVRDGILQRPELYSHARDNKIYLQ